MMIHFWKMICNTLCHICSELHGFIIFVTSLVKYSTNIYWSTLNVNVFEIVFLQPQPLTYCQKILLQQNIFMFTLPPFNKRILIKNVRSFTLCDINQTLSTTTTWMYGRNEVMIMIHLGKGNYILIYMYVCFA